MAEPVNSEHVHVEVDSDGDEISVEYPAELIAALPALQAQHPKLSTRLIGPEPGILLVRPANSIEYRNATAAQMEDKQRPFVESIERLGHNAVVWPSPEAFAAIVAEFPGVAHAAGFTAFALASGSRAAKGKGQPSSSPKGSPKTGSGSSR